MGRVGVLSSRWVTGLSARVITDLVAEIGPVWQARQDALREQRHDGERWVLARSTNWCSLTTLVHLRHTITHDVLAAWFRVDRSTITRAINEIRPLLADRGCRIESGVRLRTIADVVAYLDHARLTGLMDATEIRVRRPTVKPATKDSARKPSGKSSRPP